MGGATTKDVTDLMKLVQNTVYEKFLVSLEGEIEIVEKVK
jgi:UDP-N-acetylenolpyruvoylglucosamine reductase